MTSVRRLRRNVSPSGARLRRPSTSCPLPARSVIRSKYVGRKVPAWNSSIHSRIQRVKWLNGIESLLVSVEQLTEQHGSCIRICQQQHEFRLTLDKWTNSYLSIEQRMLNLLQTALLFKNNAVRILTVQRSASSLFSCLNRQTYHAAEYKNVDSIVEYRDRWSWRVCRCQRQTATSESHSCVLMYSLIRVDVCTLSVSMTVIVYCEFVGHILNMIKRRREADDRKSCKLNMQQTIAQPNWSQPINGLGLNQRVAYTRRMQFNVQDIEPSSILPIASSLIIGAMWDGNGELW